jgi:hypothetical protein
MAELKIEPNPRKMRWAAILLNPAAHTKELERTATASLGLFLSTQQRARVLDWH